MKFWKNTKTNELIRLGDWKRQFEQDRGCRFRSTPMMEDSLRVYINHSITQSNGTIVFLG